MKGILEAVENKAWLSVTAVGVDRRDLTLRFEARTKRRSKPKRAWLVSCRQVRDLRLTDFDGGGVNLWSRNHPIIWQFSSPKALLAISLGTRTWAECLGALVESHRNAVDDWIAFDQFVSTYKWPKSSARTIKIVGPQFLLAEYRRHLSEAGFSTRLSMPNRKLYWSGKGWSTRRYKVSMLHFGNSFVAAESFSAVAETALASL